jgi:mono/diheme cytochrome c family protein
MKRKLKIAGLVLAVLAAAAAGALFGAAQYADRKMARKLAVEPAPVAYAVGAGRDRALERGRYLYSTRGCVDCHGANGAGRVFIDDANGLYVKGPNLTSGAGGVTAAYTERDWVRAVRHGIKPDGRPLMIMPSEDYNRLTDTDFAALVAYTRALPAQAGEGAVLRLPLIVKALYGAGVIKDAAEKIDHALPPAQPVPEGPNALHGAYLANMCIGCHGATLSGGKIPGGPPDWPAAANLTPGAGSVMPQYDTPEKFRAMMRGGKRADGTAVKVMPFESLREISDTDLAALYAYLKTVPPRELGRR